MTRYRLQNVPTEKRKNTRTNLIFDVEVPRKTSYTDNEIVNWLKERIHELPGSKYFAVIQIDHEYY